MTANQAFDINAAVNKWMAILTKPSEAAFEAEKPNVNLTNMIIWLAIAGAISGFFGGLWGLIFRSGSVAGLITGLIAGAIVAVIGFFIGQAILFLVARVLGGTGDFNTQAYLQSIYFVPIYIVDGVLSIPFLGSLVALVLGLYSLYLTTLALKVTHRYDTTKAVLTWLIPAIVVGVILACIAVFFASLFAALMGGAILGGQGR